MWTKIEKSDKKNLIEFSYEKSEPTPELTLVRSEQRQNILIL
jgi:hypothetical protein